MLLMIMEHELKASSTRQQGICILGCLAQAALMLGSCLSTDVLSGRWACRALCS